MRLGVVAIFLALLPSGAVASLPPTASDIVLPDVYYLEIERDGVREATFVEPRADGMVALTAPSGTVDYVPMYRVCRVTDQNGVDLTSRLRRRDWLGTPPPRVVRDKAGVPWRSFRFRAGSRSECGSFAITDFAMMWRTSASTRYPPEDDFFGSVDCGYARNMGWSSSIGGSLFLAGDGDRTHWGLRLHLYAWPASTFSLDFAPGLILASSDDGTSRFVAPGFSGQAGLTFGGRFGILAQVFSVRSRNVYGFEGTDTVMHAGFRFGAEPGVAGSTGFLIAKMIGAMDTRQFQPRF
jgi:hypothetical protein